MVFILLDLFYVHELYVCAPRACLFTIRGQKKAPNPLELELQMVANYVVGAGNQMLVLCKANKGFLTAEPVLQPTYPILLKDVSLHAFKPSAAAGAG